MNSIEWATWAVVLFGLVLSALGVRAAFYFGHDLRVLGGNWVHRALFRVVVTITAVALVLTLNRVLVLSFGPNPVLSLINGVFIVWLLLLPELLYRTFRSHEG